MTSGPWEIIGIEPTDDRRAIKKAYAAKLKLHRPEDDPEGFQQLNEAYEFIVENLEYLLAVEQQENNDGADDFSTVVEVSNQSVVNIGQSQPPEQSQPQPPQQSKSQPEPQPQSQPQSEPQPQPIANADIKVDDSEPLPQLKPVDDTLSEFRRLLLDPHRDSETGQDDWADTEREQRCIEVWRQFLSQPEFYDIDYKAEISIDIFAQLIQFHHQRDFINLPLAVKTQLVEVFLWQDQELELCRYFDAGDVDVVLRQLRGGQESSQEEEFIPQMKSEDIQIDPMVFKMLGGIVCLLMALVLAL